MPSHAPEHAPLTLGRVIQYAFTPGSAATAATFPQLLTVVHIARLALALVFGVACGALHLEGGVYLLSFAILASMGVHAHVTLLLRADGDSYGPNALLQEGLLPCLACFTLTWATLSTVTSATPTAAGV